MKHVDVSLQWSWGFVFGVGSKNNDFKIFQCLNSDSWLRLVSRNGPWNLKYKTKYHHANLCCYKRYCLSQWFDDITTVFIAVPLFDILRTLPFNVMYHPVYNQTWRWEILSINEDFNGNICSRWGIFHWHVWLAKGYWCMRMRNCSVMICSCRGVYLQRAGKFHGALCYQTEPQVLKRRARCGPLKKMTFRNSKGLLRVYHQQPIARAYEHLRLAASPPSKIKLLLLVLLIMIMIRIILMVILESWSTASLVEHHEKWHDLPISSNIFQVDHAHDPHCLSAKFCHFCSGRLPLRARAANDTCSIPPRSALAPVLGSRSRLGHWASMAHDVKVWEIPHVKTKVVQIRFLVK